MNGVHSTPSTQRLPGDLRSPSQKSLLLSPTPSQTRLLFADSKNRDRKLLRPIKNIERVDLVSARVPKNSLSPY